MRMAGRFSRRVRGWAQAHDVPVIDCGREERKHLIAEEQLKKNPCIRGLFLILVGRAVATVWDVKRSSTGVIQNLEAKRPFINHYWFHIMDPGWGHVTIKMAGHPPFGAQIILNGHEYVACQAREAGIPFTKEGNCFTVLPNLADLARVADTLSEVRTIGRSSQADLPGADRSDAGALNGKKAENHLWRECRPHRDRRDNTRSSREGKKLSCRSLRPLYGLGGAEGIPSACIRQRAFLLAQTRQYAVP
jgi:hypothetical protein